VRTDGSEEKGRQEDHQKEVKGGIWHPTSSSSFGGGDENGRQEDGEEGCQEEVSRSPSDVPAERR